MRAQATSLLLALGSLVAGCSSGTSSGAIDAPGGPRPDTGTLIDAAKLIDAPPDAQTFPVTLDGNRDRLLHTYLAWLQAQPTITQSNGLTGGTLHTVCDLWNGLDPSSQDVFRTITHRLGGSVVGKDGSRMLDHITKLYRVNGGQNATATDAGSCGGGEYNRMIMQQDETLHAAQLAANNSGSSSPYAIADTPTGDYWRSSHDLGGPHSPFDLSDEADTGAPRGQTQYFRDTTSTLANSKLGRQDLMNLIDPYAMEMDQDYNCDHESNPDCSYTLYGTACIPHFAKQGTQIYASNYGDFETTWKPTGC